MANNRMTEGVGKKIVEALKMQSDIEITPMDTSAEENDFDMDMQDYNHNADEQQNIQQDPVQDDIDFDDEDIFNEQPAPVFTEPQPVFTEPQPVFTQPAEQPAPQINIRPQIVTSDLDDFEIPSNVAVLKQLITKLPAGVTKQTGALIIKQTMEALGISMKSVLQEAQQVQEGLNNSSRECQASITEYKKQIGILEKQAQKYQRQYAALNDIISLFVQTNI